MRSSIRKSIVRWLRRGWWDIASSPLGLYRVLGAIILALLAYVVSLWLAKPKDAMSWSAVWPSLLACLIWFAAIVVFYFGRAAYRYGRRTPHRKTR